MAGPSQPPFYRSDQALVTVTCEMVTLDKAAWELFEGGEQATPGLKVWPGGMRPMLNLGGVPERADIKVARLWSPYVTSVKKKLDRVVGMSRMGVNITPLIGANHPEGETETFTGMLLGVERAKYKSGPAEEVYMTITVGPYGPVQ